MRTCMKMRYILYGCFRASRKCVRKYVCSQSCQVSILCGPPSSLEGQSFLHALARRTKRDWADGMYLVYEDPDFDPVRQIICILSRDLALV